MRVVLVTLVLAGAVHGAMYSQHEPSFPRGPAYTQESSDVYAYMEDPMANVYMQPSSDQPNYPYRPMSPMPFQPMQYQGEYIPTNYHNHGGKTGFPTTYHHSQDGHLHQPQGSPEFPFDFDTPPYRLVQQYPEVGIEERHYKSQNWVCTRAEVDTASDPLAGLESFPPQELLSSARYQEGPQGTMHRRLKNYTQGQNKENEVMAETRPVSIRHWVRERTNGGNIEVQEMCFYLQHKYQDNHQANQQSERIPQPLDARVFILAMPEMSVYVQSFNQIAVTEAMWDFQRQQLEEKLFRMGKQYRQREFFSQCYNVLRLNTNRRSEVWIEKVESGVPAISAVSVEVDPENKETYLPHDSSRIMTSANAQFRHDHHHHEDDHEDHHHDDPNAHKDGHTHPHDHEEEHEPGHDHTHDKKKTTNPQGGR